MKVSKIIFLNIQYISPLSSPDILVLITRVRTEGFNETTTKNIVHWTCIVCKPFSIRMLLTSKHPKVFTSVRVIKSTSSWCYNLGCNTPHSVQNTGIAIIVQLSPFAETTQWTFAFWYEKKMYIRVIVLHLNFTWHLFKLI